MRSKIRCDIESCKDLEFRRELNQTYISVSLPAIISFYLEQSIIIVVQCNMGQCNSSLAAPRRSMHAGDSWLLRRHRQDGLRDRSIISARALAAWPSRSMIYRLLAVGGRAGRVCVGPAAGNQARRGHLCVSLLAQLHVPAPRRYQQACSSYMRRHQPTTTYCHAFQLASFMVATLSRGCIELSYGNVYMMKNWI